MAKWREIDGTSGKYLVSDTGLVKRVRDDRNGKLVDTILTTHERGKGYPSVSLRVNGWSKQEYVHTLVLTTFVGPRPSLQHVGNHRDGNKKNSDLTNLEWVTEAENNQHAVDLGLRVPLRGKLHQHYGKTTEEIFGRRFFGKGNPFYGKRHSQATKTRLSETSSGENSSRAKLTNAQALQIRAQFTDGARTKTQLADAFGVSWWVIHGVVTMKTYTRDTVK